MANCNTTVLRVKRRIEDNPQEALILHCKRLKTEDSNDIKSLFIFSATLSEQENMTNDISSTLKECLKTVKAPRNVDKILNKLRSERKQQILESRYEIVNCTRSLNDEDLKIKEDKVNYALIDLRSNTVAENESDKYVYDLYCNDKLEFDAALLDSIRVDNLEAELIYDMYRNSNDSDQLNEDTDDSNDEDNWRNDYPDEEDDNSSSVNEDDMVRAMNNCDIGLDLSSDEGDRIYDDDISVKVDQDDVAHYGAAYAKYKAKILAADKLEKEGFIHTYEDSYVNSDEDGQYNMDTIEHISDKSSKSDFEPY